ncbi:hypothetical protein [Streptomyces sp. WMMC897]|uniref:hypothetical protein n=1 Tax=Streptomyces sp. WMMC897 TaxID=3014782 RepID=UPI0022B73910|nr:hypothetical protein [Streptomyces sp. WMMC897]MCZ7416931.1 hypothetical protein [Streptomyces sp. WMMC897]
MNTRIARRRPSAAHVLAALAVGALTLSGCAVEGEGKAAVKPSTAAPVVSADATVPSATQEETEKTPDQAEKAPAQTEKTADQAEKAPDQAEKASDETARWAGTKQFVQIEKAWTNADRPQLSVRPAQKEPHPRFESWVITPGTGPFTTVPLAIDADVVAYVPIADERGQAEGLSPTRFVSRVMALPAAERANVGFDLTFDASGQVIRVESLYRP